MITSEKELTKALEKQNTWLVHIRNGVIERSYITTLDNLNLKTPGKNEPFNDFRLRLLDILPGDIEVDLSIAKSAIAKNLFYKGRSMWGDKDSPYPHWHFYTYELKR